MTSSTPIELDKEFIISAIEERGGEIKYLDLVNIFKKVLYQADHQERELQRKRFKDLLTCAARLVEVEGEPRVILRPPSHGNLTRGQGCDPEAFISLDFPDEDGELPALWDPGSPDPAGQSGGEKQEGDEKDDRSSCIPEVVITQADEGKWEEIAALGKPRAGEAVRCPDDPGWKSPSDGQDLHSDLQSLRSESGSLASDVAASGSAKSDVDQDCLDDDLRSITTSSVTSLFPRLQLDPLERVWIHHASLGDTVALSQLLRQDPSLASKKTGLHWAAKLGRKEMVEMMAAAGADVNARSVSEDGSRTRSPWAVLH
ncbi:ankyrin repeat domain-containing protein SOWAHC isoform X1 [Lepisosteus oculatus]|uniref:ankyrin repeat domain-containing protein SOWAHC isoform X1 n=1 Tax=Lepisosteus oculatus TaxID=7918 RepID=UPI0035F508F4